MRVSDLFFRDSISTLRDSISNFLAIARLSALIFGDGVPVQEDGVPQS
jgi:hypothetical protein